MRLVSNYFRGAEIKVMPKKIWVTWEDQPRNESMSKEMGAKLFKIDINKNRLHRYFHSIVLTLKIFYREKPEIIFVENPSIVLALIGVIYGIIFRVKIVIDQHNAGIYPLEGRSKILNHLAMIIARLAFCNIVSNIGLQKYVCSAGIKAFVIADPIPNLEKEYQNIELSDKLNIVNICSFSDDEPYNEVIKAAEYLEKEASFYITGNFREKIKNEINYKNITFTGYLERDDYLNLLASADLIIVLTLRENCLLCGAYEALFFEKPLILSRKNALIDYFGDAAIYCENRAEDIAEKVLWAKNNMGIMKGKIILGRKNIEIKWGEQMEVFNKYIELIA